MNNLSRSHVLTLILLLGILFCAVGYTLYRVYSTTPAGEQRQHAREVFAMPYRNLSDEEVSLVDYKGSVIVVNSWATWSPFSAEELAIFAQVADSYKDKKVVFIAINRGEPKAMIEAYMKTYKISDVVHVWQDAEDQFYKTHEGYAMPETIVYDRDGKIVAHKRGQYTQTELLQTLDTLVR